MRTTLFVTIVAIFARLSFAIPPGCLLHAVNTQDEPKDMSAVCGDGALDVQSYISNNCGNFEDTAQKAFIATCSAAGTSVAAYTATSSGNSTMTSTKSSSSSTGTGLITSTMAQATGGSSSNSASASASRSGSSSPISSTAGANVDYRQAALGPMAAAAIALIGAVAAL